MIASGATVVVAALGSRAGGGNGFSGGGGVGGGGFSGGGRGGGGFLFFGGGGAGGFSVIVVIILVLVISGVFFRSRRSGRWGGGSSSGGPPPGSSGSAAAPGDMRSWSGDDRPAIESVSGDLFPDSHPSASGSDDRQAGLDAIVAHDPDFNTEEFVDQVQRAFFVVQEAWTERKPEMSRRVMADGLWQQHRTQIQAFLDGNTRNVLDGLAVGSVTIVGAHSDQRYDTITTRIIATSADYTVSGDNGKVVSGHKDLEPWQEDWTFQRSSEATTPAGGGTLSSNCPNCGAPLDVDLTGQCRYCKAPVMSGRYDWVLARIAQVFA